MELVIVGLPAAADAAPEGVLPAVVAGVRVPTTPACREVTAIARKAYPPPLFNHALRAFVLARALTPGEGLDDEVLYVAALAHDLGMTDAYRSADRRFEIDGADIARRVLLDHGRDANAARIAWDAVALHATGGIARWKEPEVRALVAGVGSDFSAWPDEARRRIADDVFRAIPRTNFRATFLAAAAEVARAKPAYATGFVADVGRRMVKDFAAPANFVDEWTKDGLPD